MKREQKATDTTKYDFRFEILFRRFSQKSKKIMKEEFFFLEHQIAVKIHGKKSFLFFL